MNKKKLYETIMRQVSINVKKALNENLDIDEDDLQYAEDVDGNPDLMLGHLLRKQENSDEARHEYAVQQLEKIQNLVNSGEKYFQVAYRHKSSIKKETILVLYDHIDCDIENEYTNEFNIDVMSPVAKDEVPFSLSYIELYTNYCGPVGNMNIDRLLNGQTLIMDEDTGKYICTVLLADKI